MTINDLVNRMLQQLTPEQKQKFYEEYGKLKLSGAGEEEAVGEAFNRVGMENPYKSMKITMKNGVHFGIIKKKRARQS